MNVLGAIQSAHSSFANGNCRIHISSTSQGVIFLIVDPKLVKAWLIIVCQLPDYVLARRFTVHHALVFPAVPVICTIVVQRHVTIMSLISDVDFVCWLGTASSFLFLHVERCNAFRTLQIKLELIP